MKRTLTILSLCFAFSTNILDATSLVINRIKYISSKTIGSRLGMQHSWQIKKNTVTLTSQWTQIQLKVHKRYIIINNIKVHLGNAIVLHNEDLWLSMHDCEHTLAPILTPQTFKKIPKLYHIVIDPGHGGHDTGAQNQSKHLYEKNLTLDVAFRLKKILTRKGYKITLTRNKDVFIPLKKRSLQANQSHADLFVSIHFNAAINSTVRGIETFVYPPRYQSSSGREKITEKDCIYQPANKNNSWNTLIGYYVQKSLIKKCSSPDRGLKYSRFAVLELLNCPGILVEAGFLTNTREANAIKTPAFRQKIAQGIANGLLAYQNVLNRLTT
jgi:N-acetylmuramoyl-L-alanine amidase